MKKTLIALAALATLTSTGAYAQVAITGTLEMGYKGTHTVYGLESTDASGFGVDTSEIDFKVT